MPEMNGRANLWLGLIGIGLVFLIVMLSVHFARAHDHARVDLDTWYPTLRNQTNDPCCDGSEARHLADVDWDSKDGHYRVHIDDDWVDVPKDAVIDGPNRDGRTLVWPTWKDGKRAVRCFMPGSMT